MNQLVPHSWATTWMRIAHTIAERSKDPSTRCGSVVVNNKRLLGVGFNGPPEYINDDSFDWSNRDEKYPLVFHSESNALWNSVECHGVDTIMGSTLYVTGQPCYRCVLECVRAKLLEIVYDDTPKGNQAVMCDKENWKKVLWIVNESKTILTPYSHVGR